MRFDLHKPNDNLTFLAWDRFIKTEIAPKEFIIEGMVPVDGVTLITGEGGIGKSYMLMEMAHAVASQTDFLGRFKTVWGFVVIIDLENDDATVIKRGQKILHAHRLAKGRTCDIGRPLKELCCESSPTHICDFVLPIYALSKKDLVMADMLLDRESGRQSMIDILDYYSPSLVIIDPLTAIHSADENDNIAMRQIIMNLQHLAREYHLAVVVVHHPRKRGVINDGGQMIRGASDLRNAVDSHIFMRKLSNTQLLIEHDKCRHAPALEKFKVDMLETDDGLGTSFTYVGDATESAVKQAEARECILSLLNEAGSCKRGELEARAASQGIRRSTVHAAIQSLCEQGVIKKLDRGIYGIAPPKLSIF